MGVFERIYRRLVLRACMVSGLRCRGEFFVADLQSNLHVVVGKEVFPGKGKKDSP